MSFCKGLEPETSVLGIGKLIETGENAVLVSFILPSDLIEDERGPTVHYRTGRAEVSGAFCRRSSISPRRG